MRSLATILTLSIVLGLATGLPAAPTMFVVPMSGTQEVSGGDPDGTGLANLTIDATTLTIDWSIVVSNIALPTTGAHIHFGPVGVDGPIVVNFNNQLTGAGLTDSDLAAILANPANYYVNVHNDEYPDGAIRGQLCSNQIVTPVPVPSALVLGALGLTGFRFVRHKLAR